MEKEEILANLYALRAGLSLVSTKKDDYDEVKNQINLKDKLIASNKEEEVETKKNIKKYNQEIKKEKERNLKEEALKKYGRKTNG